MLLVKHEVLTKGKMEHASGLKSYNPTLFALFASVEPEDNRIFRFSNIKRLLTILLRSHRPSVFLSWNEKLLFIYSLLTNVMEQNQSIDLKKC